MWEMCYFCLDTQAFAYAQRHLENKYTQVIKCHEANRLNLCLNVFTQNKKKSFFMLKTVKQDTYMIKNCMRYKKRKTESGTFCSITPQ